MQLQIKTVSPEGILFFLKQRVENNSLWLKKTVMLIYHEDTCMTNFFNSSQIFHTKDA